MTHMQRPPIVDDTPEDARWRRLQDAALAGEALSAGDADFVREHQAIGDLAREEQRLLAELAGLAEVDDKVATGDDAADERAIAAAIDAVLGPAPNVIELGEAGTRRSRRGRGVIAGVAIGLAAAAAWLLVVRPLEQVPSDMVERTASRIAAVTRESAQTPERAVEGPLRLLSGSFDGPDAPAIGEVIAAGPTPLRSRGGACLGIEGVVRTCLEDQAMIVVGDDRRVDLIAGAARVEVAAPAVNVAWTAVGAYAVVAEEAGAYTLSVEGERWELRSEAGALRIDGPDGGSERIAAAGSKLHEGLRIAADAADDDDDAVVDTDAVVDSDAVVDTDPPGDATHEATKSTTRPTRSPRTPTADPAARLREAQSLRAAGDHAAAARAYKEVIAADPRGPLARTSQVALGQLYLGPLADPKAALRAFDAYLKAGGGAMSEEALHGKVSALDRLGRTAAADAAAEEFLRRFPASRYAAALRTRGR